jgi:Fe-S-cluster-containing dehydrogenase component/formate-dependent nitrite reductase membrane component NrfD
MQLGFLMDHRRCIGCHACTVACKSENDVPLGSFRTWVKYTEKGTFPAVKRHFAVLRCNHCTNAPCVTICPVTALSKRPDGIVDIDRDACIGCRACMQGCPYDAIYLNEDSGSVEKCHFCAHRIEQNLAPACVVVCPEEAIVFGDVHDPSSRIAKMIAEHPTLLRRTEQKTGPNVHYLETLPESLEPGLAERPETYIWSERPPTKPDAWPASVPTAPNVRTVLDVGHKVQWGWQVAAYLVTKGIAAGAAILAPFAEQLGLGGAYSSMAPEILALVFITLTTILLVEDLARPMKFFTLLTRPNTRSWLVKGAWILIGFSLTVTATLALLVAQRFAETDADRDFLRVLVYGLRWINAVLGLGVAGYTAFLFKQCEGRDLWQEPRLLPHLLVQALFLGAVSLAPFADDANVLARICIAGLIAHTVFVSLELRGKTHTANHRQAQAFLDVVKMGPIARPYRLGGRAGVMMPVALLALASLGTFAGLAPVLTGLAALTAAAGLFIYKYAYIRAAQLPPLS